MKYLIQAQDRDSIWGAEAMGDYNSCIFDTYEEAKEAAIHQMELFKNEVIRCGEDWENEKFEWRIIEMEESHA